MIETPAPPREAFVQKIRDYHLAPLWDVLPQLITAEPKSVIAPYRWRYEEMRPHLLESAKVITAKEAERRVLVLENPKLPGQSKITRSLFGGLQIIMPGEVAPPHRHIQAALRFIIEGNGAYTAVDGERTYMHPGDFVITPSWTYHDHGNEDRRPDGLARRPRHAHGELVRSELPRRWSVRGSDGPEKPELDSLYRYGHNLVPIEHAHRRPTSPIFSYPYDRTREALEAMRRAEDPSPWFGYKMRYINPLTGGDAIPTISTFMQLFPTG